MLFLNSYWTIQYQLIREERLWPCGHDTITNTSVTIRDSLAERQPAAHYCSLRFSRIKQPSLSHFHLPTTLHILSLQFNFHNNHHTHNSLLSMSAPLFICSFITTLRICLLCNRFAWHSPPSSRPPASSGALYFALYGQWSAGRTLGKIFYPAISCRRQRQKWSWIDTVSFECHMNSDGFRA